MATQSIQTVIKNVKSELIKEYKNSGFDEQYIKDELNKLLEEYSTDGLKIRKLPAKPKPKTPTEKSKEKKLKWQVHPGNPEYLYTTDIKLANGYPVKDSNTNKIIAVINENETANLTAEDVKSAYPYRLPIEASNVDVEDE